MHTITQHRNGAEANTRGKKNRQLVGGGASSVPYDPPTACYVVTSLSLLSSLIPVSCVEGWSSCPLPTTETDGNRRKPTETDGNRRKPTNLPSVTKSAEIRKMSRNVTDVIQHRKIAFSYFHESRLPPKLMGAHWNPNPENLQSFHCARCFYGSIIWKRPLLLPWK